MFRIQLNKNILKYLKLFGKTQEIPSDCQPYSQRVVWHMSLSKYENVCVGGGAECVIQL